MPGPVVEELEIDKKLENEVAVVEDVKEEDEHDEVDDSDDDEDGEKDDGAQGGSESSKQTRSEKKSRKAMLKLGMKPVTGVTRVAIKRTKNAKIEDLSSQLQTQAAQQFRFPDMGSVISKSELPSIAQADEEEEEVDETDVNARDIELVTTQAGVSRNKAVKALKTHQGDIVSAIMELTT